MAGPSKSSQRTRRGLMSKYPVLNYVGDVYIPSEDTWLLLDLIKERVPKGNLCLDLGAGSGVLGLYALLNELCGRVLFIDIENDAVETACLNIQLNDVSARSIVVQSNNISIREESIDVVFQIPLSYLCMTH